MIVPTFPIRLIALDIDGTLIDDELTIGPRTRAAIRAAMERDVAVSLVTGRMVRPLSGSLGSWTSRVLSWATRAG